MCLVPSWLWISIESSKPAGPCLHQWSLNFPGQHVREFWSPKQVKLFLICLAPSWLWISIESSKPAGPWRARPFEPQAVSSRASDSTHIQRWIFFIFFRVWWDLVRWPTTTRRSTPFRPRLPPQTAPSCRFLSLYWTYFNSSLNSFGSIFSPLISLTEFILLKKIESHQFAAEDSQEKREWWNWTLDLFLGMWTVKQHWAS